LLAFVPCLSVEAQSVKDDTAPRKFDEYVLSGEQRWNRLDRFIKQLKREPKKQAYIIVYAERKIEGSGVHYDGEDWRSWVFHNLKARGVGEDRYVSVNGGLRDQDMIELWLVTPGGRVPAPTPTAKETIVCPTVTVRGDGYVRQRDQPLTFTTHLSAWQVYSFPGATFNWTVSAGRIVSGAGTDRLTVDASQTDIRTVIARVSVGGLSIECANTDAARTDVGIVPYKFDDFGHIRMGDLKARLDNFALYLQLDNGLRGYVITYSARNGDPDQAKNWAGLMKDYLVSTRGLEPSQIETLPGGYREEQSGEFWLVPHGTSAPNPSPTVDPRYVSPLKRSRAKASKGQ